MASIHTVVKDDDVCGQIIGGVQFQGALYYSGRKQGRTFYAADHAGVKHQADDALAEMRKEHGDLFKTIWPGDMWELRIF